MARITPRSSKNAVNRAGVSLKATPPDTPEYDNAFEIAANWRAAHAFPLNTIQTGIRVHARAVYESALVAQRLKRMPSIVSKLHRSPTMKLCQMQDIGGCRAILRTNTEVYRAAVRYSTSAIRHSLKRVHDYIQQPRRTGYRSLHLVYAYESDRNPLYNGLLIEVQIRTLLQHAWATAVETVGLMTKQDLKSGLGNQKWLRFFALVSSAFAYVERSNRVPYTPRDYQKLLSRIRDIEQELKCIHRLETYNQSLRILENTAKDANYEQFLLILHLGRGVAYKGFSRRERAEALAEYYGYERHSDKDLEVVLVSVDSARQLHRAYPSFFGDTRRFVRQVRKILQ